MEAKLKQDLCPPDCRERRSAFPTNYGDESPLRSIKALKSISPIKQLFLLNRIRLVLSFLVNLCVFDALFQLLHKFINPSFNVLVIFSVLQAKQLLLFLFIV